jgi:hypothetical protein
VSFRRDCVLARNNRLQVVVPITAKFETQS